MTLVHSTKSHYVAFSELFFALLRIPDLSSCANLSPSSLASWGTKCCFYPTYNGENTANSRHQADQQVGERYSRCLDLHSKGIYLVDEKDSGKNCILHVMVILIGMSTFVSCIDPGFLWIIFFSVIILQELFHQWPKPFSEKVSVRFQYSVVALIFYLFEKGWECLGRFLSADPSNHVFSSVGRWDNLDEVLKKASGTVFVLNNLCDTIHSSCFLFTWAKTQLMNHVACVKIRGVFGQKGVNVTTVAFDTFSHGYMEIPSDSVDCHVSR
mmetsp:Transcript_24611/g.41857  ORF Transcript_24611/g.41857 Transcript_24611/m.41857 type:complete len:269 (-) Transcript_24611:625-1431(-)